MGSGIEMEDIKVVLGEAAEAQHWCQLMKIRQNHVGRVKGQHFIENYGSQGQEVDGDVPKIKRRPE